MVGLRTEIAGTADSVATALNTVLSDVTLAPGDYVPELVPPSEQSTGGGVRALQRLRLVPKRPGHPTLVIGALNMSDRSGELRSYALLDAVHRKRFKKPVPLVRGEYDALVTKLRVLLKALDVNPVLRDVATELDDPDDADAPVAATRSRATVYVVAIAALLAAAALAAWLLPSGR